MRIQQVFLLGACLFFSAVVSGQSVCSFDEKYEKLTQTDISFATQVQQTNKKIQDNIISRRAVSKKSAAVIYSIPVVIHVMHTGGSVGTPYNPGDAQIQSVINYLNQVYAGTWPGMKPQQGASAVTDLEIQFVLAKRAPGCGSTNGIDRVDASSLTNYVQNGVNSSSSSGVNEIDLKNFARWDPSKYYNVWLVNKIDGADGTSGQFVGGYAYYPGVSPWLDGTVMLATQMFAGNKVLPHELAHALGIYHTFQGSANATQCPSNITCLNDGDRVCDTDPVTNNVTGGIYNFDCRTGNNDCLLPTVGSYSINTEENFMAYTNCANLFTQGQKERMQAALTLPSRSSLVDGSNQSLIPCGTEIAFSQSGASALEPDTNATLDCRHYRDYSYQMVINKAPTADATVTFYLGGTTIRGLDYEFAANGDFLNPSDQIIFAAGSATAQPFSIRVYDDANVEPAETLRLDFTVDNGGGDAVKSPADTSFILQINDNDIEPVASYAGNVTLGTNSGNINAAPFDATLSRQRIQWLYRANELNNIGITAGNIQSIALNITQKNSTRPFSNFNIKMGVTNTNVLVDESSAIYFNGLTTVYSSASQATSFGWNSYTLSSAFSWDGVSAVVIEICYDNSTANASAGKDYIASYTDGSASNQGNMIFQGIDCATSFTGVTYYNNGRKPVIRWGVEVDGVQIEDQQGAYADLHIGNTDDEYIYSNNGRLMAHITATNNSLECVNSSLTGAGSVWPAFSGGYRSAKTIAISPGANGGSTSYTISLYFNNAELNGFSPGNIRLAKTSATNINDANDSNTVIVTPTVTTLGSDITVFTASFTGFSTFFLTTGTVTLPADILSLKAIATPGGDAALNWSTGFEQNSIGFDIERSGDGINFIRVGSVLSKGDTRTGHVYNYTDDIPEAGIYYYRLKQKDIDGATKYSAIVDVKVMATGKVKITPVPVRDILTIVLPRAANNTSIQVFTTSGQSMLTRKLTAGLLTEGINVATLPQGVYFIRVSQGTETQVLRFIKE